MNDAICAVSTVPCEADVGGETRQDGSLGCSVVAVITVCLHLCGCDTTRGSHGAVLCVSFNLKNTLNCV